MVDDRSDAEPGIDYLFVYGTLVSSFGHPMHTRVCRYARYLTHATMDGTLFDLGDYPAARAEGQGSVHGELYAILDIVRLFKALDRYEGREYIRKKVTVRTDGGTSYDAWVYCYRFPLSYGRRILDGIYRWHRFRHRDRKNVRPLPGPLRALSDRSPSMRFSHGYAVAKKCRPFRMLRRDFPRRRSH